MEFETLFGREIYSVLIMEESIKPIPDILGMSMYESIELKDFNYLQLSEILTFHENSINEHSITSLDCYCNQCGKETTFKSRNSNDKIANEVHLKMMACNEMIRFATHNSNHEFDYSSFHSSLEKIELFNRSFYCPRASNDLSHDVVIILRVNDGKITKIGQFPQLADLENSHLKKYKVLDKEIHQELNRAAGLNSHGIGVGSFVYLRRIIEKYILYPELERLIEESTLTTEQISSAKFNQKVALAKDHLPSVLADNPRIYSILSKGIHSLSEKECLEIFSPLLTAIELILDERLEKVEREKKLEKMKNDLNRITN
jgi:hypothetical protein